MYVCVQSLRTLTTWHSPAALLCAVQHTHTHTHTHPFNGPLSGTTWVSRYQIGKTNLDFTGARDSEWQWHQLGMRKSAPRSRQITMPAPHHSVFYRPDALPAAQPTASEHWRPCSNRTNYPAGRATAANIAGVAHVGTDRRMDGRTDS